MVRKIMNIKINNLSNTVIIFFSLFAISLPFHAIEYDLFGLSRFEIKITMIPFERWSNFKIKVDIGLDYYGDKQATQDFRKNGDSLMGAELLVDSL